MAAALPVDTPSRVLWLSAETPDRFGQGGQRRQFHLVRELARRGHRVTVIVPRSDQDDTLVKAVADRVERPRLHVRGRAVPGARRRLDRLVASPEWDAVVLSHTESAWLLPAGGTAAALLVDMHNVASAWSAGGAGSDAQRQAQSAESALLDVADAVTVCSDVELRRLHDAHPGSRTTAFTVPLGVDPAEWPDERWDRTEAILAMFGSWGWLPNARGLEWFAREVWPAVIRDVPGARALVAGSPPAGRGDWAEGMVYVGRVDDLAAFTARATVVAVPVIDGVGASVKFAESLASGSAVIATPDGANAFADPPAVVSDDSAAWSRWIAGRLRTRHDDEVPDGARRTAVTELTWARAVEPLHRWISAVQARR